MKKEPWEWDLGDLQNLFGQTESMRLEFKSSRILELSPDKLSDEFSKAISAFANTEGGTIIIGIQERRQGKSRVADTLDQGISFSQYSPETLQQMIESNISPPLPRLRFRVIQATQPKHYYLVIYVPQGTTAYQAKDCRYYGRSEYEAKPLRDHEIRLRMLRGKLSDAVLRVTNLKSETVLEKAQKPISKRGEEVVEESAHEVVQLSFDLILENIGEVNITQFKVLFYMTPPLFVQNTQTYSFRDGKPDPRSWFPRAIGRDPEPSSMDVCVFPMDEYRIISLAEKLPSLEDFPAEGVTLNWRLYLPDRLPIDGVIGINKDQFEL